MRWNATDKQVWGLAPTKIKRVYKRLSSKQRHRDDKILIEFKTEKVSKRKALYDCY